MSQEQELQKLVWDVTDKVEGWTYPGRWQAEPGSEAASEFANNEQRPDGTTWGDGPVQAAFAYAQMAMMATIQHGRAVATLVHPSRPILPQEALTRSALEAASVAWWLLEPGLGARRRVARMQVLRLNSATEDQKTLNVLAKAGVNVSGIGGETVPFVKSYSAALGLATFTESRKGRGYDQCESEIRPGYTKRVTQLTDAAGFHGAYPIYSGVAHAELNGLWRVFSNGATAAAGGQRSYHIAPDYEATFHAAHGALVSLLYPLMRVASVFGWPSPGRVDNLNALIDGVDTEMARLRP